MNRSPLMLALWVGFGCGATVSAGAQSPNDGVSEAELPGAELLEFLGGWEGENDEWQEFFDSLPAVREVTPPGDGASDRDED